MRFSIKGKLISFDPLFVPLIRSKFVGGLSDSPVKIIQLSFCIIIDYYCVFPLLVICTIKISSTVANLSSPW